jgi:hypothetical protein
MVTDTRCGFRKDSFEAVGSHSFSFDLRKYGVFEIMQIDKLTRLLFNLSLKLGLVTLQTPLDLDLCVPRNVFGSLDARNVPGAKSICRALTRRFVPSFSSFHA